MATVHVLQAKAEDLEFMANTRPWEDLVMGDVPKRLGFSSACQQVLRHATSEFESELMATSSLLVHGATFAVLH